MTALAHKSWRDLHRRPARSVLTVVTIAFAVTGLWIFAMPPLMDRAMERVIAEGKHLTADIGGTASTIEMGDAVARAVSEVARR